MSIQFHGRCSWFGGPKDNEDDGVGPAEGLALYEQKDIDEDKGMVPFLFLRKQPEGTTGVARRLNPDSYYIACRWDYAETSKEFLKKNSVTVVNPINGKVAKAAVVDWGPNKDTKRVADLSPGLFKVLGLKTNDVVNVIIPTEID